MTEFNAELRKYLANQLTRKYATQVVVGEGKPPERAIDAGKVREIQHVVDNMESIYSYFKPSATYNLPDSKQQIYRLSELILNSQDRPISVVSPVCPDYSGQRKSDGSFSYDFRRLGTGPGQIAEHLLETVPTFLDKLRELGISITYFMLMADVEGDDSSITATLKMSREDFLKKVSLSVEALQAEAIGNFGDSVHVQLMSDYIQDEDIQRAKRLVQSIKEVTLVTIASARRNIYDQFYQGSEDYHDYLVARARNDVLRSLTFGSAVRRNRGMILDATDKNLGSFYNYGNDLQSAPVVSIKKNY